MSNAIFKESLMTTTIENLRAELEELEKRVRSISATQTSLSQLVEMRKYFETMHNYLVLLNNCYTNHQIECNQYSTQIQEIQNQLELINQKLQNFNPADQQGLQEINERIETLTLNLNSAMSELDTLKGGSENTISNLTLDVETNKINISSILDEIEEINAELSQTNENFSDQQTKINNLSSTQNTLSTTMSTLNSRLTAVEANIDSLTEGVDVAYLDERISILEENNGQIIAYEKYEYNVSPSNNTFYTRNYYYTVPYNTKINHNIDLDYICSTHTGTLTIETYLCDTLHATKIIDLDIYPNGYKFNIPFTNIYKFNNIKLKISSTESIQINNLSLIITARNINLVKFDHDLSVITFNGYTYITKHENSSIKFGKFSTSDEIDVYNLPNELTNHDDEFCYSWQCYIPFAKCSIVSQYYKLLVDVIVKEANDDKKYIDYFPKTTPRPGSNANSNNRLNSSICCGLFESMFIVNIYQDTPAYERLDFGGPIYTYSKIKDLMPNSWLFATHINHNYRMYEDEVIKTKPQIIAKYSDGYMYYCNEVGTTYATKIGIGSFATAYKQQNGNINVYITNNNGIDKYTLTQNPETNKYESTQKIRINDCDIIYETLYNKIIKHSVSTKIWSIDALEY